MPLNSRRGALRVESGKPLTGNNERSLSSKRPVGDRSGVTGEYRGGIGCGNLPAVFYRHPGKREQALCHFLPPPDVPSLPVSSYVPRGSSEGFRYSPIGPAQTSEARNCTGSSW